MTPLERYDDWIDGKRAPGMTFKRARELALKLGFTEKYIDNAILSQRLWLAANENEKKADKTYWGKFFLNWLKPKSSRQTDRLAPSNFD